MRNLNEEQKKNISIEKTELVRHFSSAAVGKLNNDLSRAIVLRFVIEAWPGELRVLCSPPYDAKDPVQRRKGREIAKDADIIICRAIKSFADETLKKAPGTECTPELLKQAYDAVKEKIARQETRQI